MPLYENDRNAVNKIKVNKKWNDLLFGMVLTRSQEVRPIMVALASLSGYAGGTIPLIMAGVIFTSIPTIILFVLLRKFFISGMVLSMSGE